MYAPNASASVRAVVFARAVPILEHASPPGENLLARLALQGSGGETGDETVNEEVVDHGDGDAGDQTRGHERAPVEDVAADQRHGHTQAHRHLPYRADERQRVYEVLHHQGESQ